MRARRPHLHHLAFAVVAATLVLGPSPASAQCTAQDQALPMDTPWNPSRPFIVLLQLDGKDCLGGPSDNTTIAVAVRKALMVPPDDASLFQPAARSALVLVDGYLQNTTPASPEILREARLQVGVTLATLGSGASPALPTAWEPDQGRIFVISQSLQGYVTGACALRDAACATAFDTAKEVLRVARLTRLALLRSETPFFRGLLEVNLKREKSWGDYFERARSQYIWELALNSWRMGDSRQEVSPGVRGGFRDVPTSQIILLHPYVAMEYANAEAEGNKFNGTVLVDLVGYNRWSWKPDGAMGFAIGGSLILAASDHAATDDFAVGAMLHVNHQWSIGLVFGGDDPTVVVSADVAQLWTKVSALRKAKMMTGR